MELLLPEDLIYQILLHLPVESLLQFKLVCKSWLSLIQCPNFINQHLQQYHDENLIAMDTNFLIERRDTSFRISILSITNFHVLENIIDLPHPHSNKTAVYVRLVASYNGVICLQHGWRESFPDFSLFNSTTKQFHLLPISQLPEPFSKTSVTAGFGFDANTNDYKVLRMMANFYGHESADTRFEIYSLNTNSWKTIEINLPRGLHPNNIENVQTPFRNGMIICWIGFFQTSTPHLRPDNENFIWPTTTLCLFDCSKEAFETVPLPGDNYGCSYKLALLRENLACIVPKGFNEGAKQIVEWSIWMLNGYGVKEPWTKLYTVWLHHDLHPMGFLKNEEIICRKWSKFKNELPQETELVLSNSVTHELENFPIQTGASDFQFPIVIYKKSLIDVSDYDFPIAVYKKSLVSVKPKIV